MVTTVDVGSLSRTELETLVVALLGDVAGLRQQMVELREEIARLKGLKGRPDIKPPSGMEKATSAKSQSAKSQSAKSQSAKSQSGAKRRGRGPSAPRVAVEPRVIKLAAPPQGAQFKGYQDFTVQDIVLHARVICYRRERWVDADGNTLVAPLPDGIDQHFGPQLRRYVLHQYHQGQVTIERLVAQLQALGISISKRHVVRLLNAGQDVFHAENQAVLEAGLQSAAFVSADDTGARHAGRNGYCTQIGNDDFTWFATTMSKSRLNFLQLLCAGQGDYLIDDNALAYARGRGLGIAAITRLAGDPVKHFADRTAWLSHLQRLNIGGAEETDTPAIIATEAALWGSICGHGMLKDTVILSDDAGQFAIGLHALCWVHAERLVHKLTPVTPQQVAAQETMRTLIWTYYADLKAYQKAPDAEPAERLRARFDDIFARRTGWVTLDRLLARLAANKAELLVVLDRPEIPLHTNGSERDIRCQVIKRHISGGTHSPQGRAARDTFLGLMHTCRKLSVSYWNYLGDRLGIAATHIVPPLPDLIRARAGPT
jgi:hypothetical protein